MPKHLNYLTKDQIINATRGLFVYTNNRSYYEDDIWLCLLDYLECSTDNRNEEDYEELGANMIANLQEVTLIVKLGKKKQYVKVDETKHSFTFVDNINDCTVFNILNGNLLDFYLHRVREKYKNDKFIAQTINTNLLNEPLENLIQGLKV